MRRLSLQIYLALVGVLVLFAVLVSLAWWSLRDVPESRAALAGYATLVGELLPAADADRAAQQAALTRMGELTHARLTLHAAAGEVLAYHGEPLPAPPPRLAGSDFVHLRGAGTALALRLGDGRWLVGQWRRPRSPAVLPLVLALLLGSSAVGAYPLARRITRRLERLEARVEALGAGDLAARVEVEGRDEVARLAARFNEAAARIERLVMAQRSLLAGASHELRSPLARLRVALELAGSSPPPALAAQVARDIAELDGLIDELLLASRLDAADARELREPVDLLALLAEEAARLGAEATGEAVVVTGDPQQLRRMLRNLLENARRHAAGTPIAAQVAPRQGGVTVIVADRGPGVAAGERERIFEPFYRPAGWREGPQGGVGLGLALVRRIARSHGGEARCLERAGGGAVFEVTLASDGRAADGEPQPGTIRHEMRPNVGPH